MDAQTEATLSSTGSNLERPQAEKIKTSATQPHSTTLQANWSELLSRLDCDEPLTTQDMFLIADKVATEETLI